MVILGRFLGGAGVGVRGSTVAGDFLEGGNPRKVVFAGGVTTPFASLAFEPGLLNPVVHAFRVRGVLGARSSLVTGGANALAVSEGVV